MRSFPLLALHEATCRCWIEINYATASGEKETLGLLMSYSCGGGVKIRDSEEVNRIRGGTSYWTGRRPTEVNHQKKKTEMFCQRTIIMISQLVFVLERTAKMAGPL